jgi:hypothetical protein
MTLNATQELRKVRHLYLRGAVLGTCGLTHGLDPTRHEHKRGVRAFEASAIQTGTSCSWGRA